MGVGPWPTTGRSAPVRPGAARARRPAQRRRPLPLLAARRDRRRPRHPPARLPRRRRELGPRLQHRLGHPDRERVQRRRLPHRRPPPLEPARRDGHRPLPARAPPRDGARPWSRGPPGRRRPAADRHRQPARVGRRWRPTTCRGACVLRLRPGGPGPLGAGARGLRRRCCDIAQFGSTRSINAGAAAAVAMHAWVRRHVFDQSPRAWLRRPAGARRPARTRGRVAAGAHVQGSAQHAGTRPASTPVDRAGGVPMPIATPEVYADMLDRAKAGSFAYPAINVSSSQTLNAAIRGLRRGRQRRHRPGLDRRRRVPLRPDRQEHGERLAGARRVRARGRQELPRQHRAAHRPLPQGQARRLRPAAARRVDRAGQGRRHAVVPVAHVGRLGGAARGEPRDRPGAARPGQGRATSSSRSRSASSAARRTASRAAIDDKLYSTPEDALATVEALGARRERPLPDGADLRQRARRLQAGQRQAAPRDPQAGAGGGRQGQGPRAPTPSRSTWSSTAAPARCPRRSPRPSTTASSR